jgi:chromate transporter
MVPVLEVFRTFLTLGCTLLGGPIVHLASFRTEFVERRKWLSESEYADTIALCQALPGPTSSQVGFAIGLRRAGLAGGIAAWTGFTLPAAVILGTLGFLLERNGGDGSPAWLLGLRAFAVPVVAWAVWGMARSLATTSGRAVLAALATVALLAAERTITEPHAAGLLQPAAIVACAAIGWFAFRSAAPAPDHDAIEAHADRGKGVPRTVALVALVAFLGALSLAGFVRTATPIIEAASACCRAGALVFGGGHVVLPLLAVPFTQHGWLERHEVLSASALAQATPGPLFAMASYLGAAMLSSHGFASAAAGAALLTSATFMPGLLLVVAVLPAWQWLRAAPGARAALAGANCAVIGILASALVGTVAPGGVTDRTTAAIALVGLLLLATRIPRLLLAAAAAAAGALLLH